MKEIGIVKSIDGVSATVVVARKSSCCDSCEKDICEIPADGIETEALNIAGATVGQKVKIVMSSHTFVKGTLLFYILPVIALILGSVAGQLYLPYYANGTDPEILAVGGGFLAFILSLGFISIIMRKMDKKTENRSVIEKVIT